MDLVNSAVLCLEAVAMIWRPWNYSVDGEGWQSCTYQAVLSMVHYVLMPLEAYNYPLQNTAAWVMGLHALYGNVRGLIY